MTIKQMLLTPNKYSRPKIALKKITKIAVHYVGNPSTTALNNRNYFESLKDQVPDSTGKYWKGRTWNGEPVAIRYVSSHYIVGLDGEVIQCIPDDEIAYTTNQANAYSIGIETCHPRADGVFNDATYISLCELCAALLIKYKLTENDLIRHYDVTKKQCPLAWSPTKYQSANIATAKWQTFKNDVKNCMQGKKVTRNNTVDVVAIVTPDYLYKVKINSPDGSLNVRTGAGINYPIAKKGRSSVILKNGFIYTIIKEQKVGDSIWGKLMSEAGWINVSEKYCIKL